MSLQSIKPEREKGSIPHQQRVVDKALLERLIKERFGIDENLSGFLIRKVDVMEVISGDKRRGYVFTYNTPRTDGHESEMLKYRGYYDMIGRRFVNSFIDTDERVSGFCWGNK